MGGVAKGRLPYLLHSGLETNYVALARLPDFRVTPYRYILLVAEECFKVISLIHE